MEKLKQLKDNTYRWEHYNKYFNFHENTVILTHDNLKKFTYYSQYETNNIDIFREQISSDYIRKFGKNISIGKLLTIITGITVTATEKTTVTLQMGFLTCETFDIQAGKHYYPFIIPPGFVLYNECELQFGINVECEFEFILLPIDYLKAFLFVTIAIPEHGLKCTRGELFYDPLLRDHNCHLKALGKPIVQTVNNYEYEQIENLYIQLSYEPGGEKYLESERKIHENFLKIM